MAQSSTHIVLPATPYNGTNTIVTGDKVQAASYYISQYSISSTTSIGSGVDTIIPFSTLEIDPNNWFNTTTTLTLRFMSCYITIWTIKSTK